MSNEIEPTTDEGKNTSTPQPRKSLVMFLLPRFGVVALILIVGIFSLRAPDVNGKNLAALFADPRTKPSFGQVIIGNQRSLTIKDQACLDYLATALLDAKDEEAGFSPGDVPNPRNPYDRFRAGGLSYDIELFLKDGRHVTSLVNLNQDKVGMMMAGKIGGGLASETKFYILLFPTPLPPKLAKGLDFLLKKDSPMGNQTIE